MESLPESVQEHLMSNASLLKSRWDSADVINQGH